LPRQNFLLYGLRKLYVVKMALVIGASWWAAKSYGSYSFIEDTILLAESDFVINVLPMSCIFLPWRYLSANHRLTETGDVIRIIDLESWLGIYLVIELEVSEDDDDEVSWNEACNISLFV
jgi:hypothetical protein